MTLAQTVYTLTTLTALLTLTVLVLAVKVTVAPRTLTVGTLDGGVTTPAEHDMTPEQIITWWATAAQAGHDY